MREIKFRGMNLCGNWVYGDLRHNLMCMPDGKLQEYISVCGEPIHPKSVGQFTGLKDSEGREIYEGDLLAVSPPVYDECKDFKFPVIYHEGAFIVTGGVEVELGDFLTFGRVTVIGNMHDSPELLEADDARD